MSDTDSGSTPTALAVVDEEEARQIALREERQQIVVALRAADDRMRVAEAMFHGGMIKGCVNALQAFALLVMGSRLGLSELETVNSIDMIEGRPRIRAKTQMALAKRAGVRFRWLETTDKIARLSIQPPGEEAQTFTWTIEQATRAGLTGKGVWKGYAPAMLRARCLTDAIGAVCPEVLGGSPIYTREEVPDRDYVPDINNDGIPAPSVIDIPDKVDGGEAATAAAPDRAWDADRLKIHAWLDSRGDDPADFFTFVRSHGVDMPTCGPQIRRQMKAAWEKYRG